MALNAPTHLLLRLFSEDTGSSRTMAETNHQSETSCLKVYWLKELILLRNNKRSPDTRLESTRYEPESSLWVKPAEGDENIREDPTMVLLAQRRADVENWCFTCVACPTRNAPHAKVLAPMLIQLVGYPFKRWPETFLMPEMEAVI
ncbi:hypothetical protein T4C_8813 [Trichinella pseudospiralis]|uniref:Uncharacterized protein n=1 Tax=Trichinella pseudospiralis TaxID=6337 RepID=A0A0V1JSU9_TRIPS|nr:hypothetical protein T4C_8813 [Trichinella pseudospiralis]